ncbi:hypothetical protein TRFO_23980 [Tritrichomonas foetus]|uniref:Uncharacterized protein n=1 Tax=Tritrichomonas foetus TaxID=1144522 RepID=A0A1J4K8H8_9EUKA|nr:hypothetical protein TRFO_23980 [Tritrichomonas foetus]|eukprot:OHT07711.1 hypothetical protein TRFO_23980 [Tritrichomonas foetus]
MMHEIAYKPTLALFPRTWPEFLGDTNEFNIAVLQNKNNINQSPKQFTIPIISQTNSDTSNKFHHSYVSKHPINYEKNRINKTLSKIGNFDIATTAPYKWMMKEIGRAITQKEFISLYPILKKVIPSEYAPNRDASRSQKVRYVWLNSIWDKPEIRQVVEQLLRKVVTSSY